MASLVLISLCTRANAVDGVGQFGGLVEDDRAAMVTRSFHASS